jgi:hypothetical protein
MMERKSTDLDFRKIAIKGGATVMLEFTERILFEDAISGDKRTEEAEFTYVKSILPHADFIAAMQGLKGHLMCLCELSDRPDTVPEEHFNRVTVTGITKGGKDEHAGITIVAQKALKTGKVLNLVSPFVKFSEEESGGYEWSYELVELLGAVELEAREYLANNKRGLAAQLELDFSGASVTIIPINPTSDETATDTPS